MGCKVSGHLTPSGVSRLFAPLVAARPSASHQTLEHIDLNSVGLTGSCRFMLGEVQQITSLTFVDLSNNNLYGDIPEQPLHALPRLRGLNMACNHACGPIPDLHHLRRLYLLNLSGNMLSGCISEALWSASSIRELWLNHNSREFFNNNLLATEARRLAFSMNTIALLFRVMCSAFPRGKIK